MTRIDYIFNFVYTMALRDATMRKAYEGEKKPLFTLIPPKDIVKEYVNNVLDGKLNCRETADEITEKAIRDITDAFSAASFTFGNAQKLLNMTMKYLYISAYGDTAKEQEYRDRFQFCHCPMDGSMIKTIYKNKENSTIKDLLSRGRNGRGLYSDTAWSRISDKAPKAHNTLAAYEDFQNAIRALAKNENLIPLEIDYEYFLQ